MLIVLMIVLGIIAVVLALAALQPGNFRISRSLEMAAPAKRIFPYIEDFTKWSEWSPYEKLDPAMKREMGSLTRGKGATYAWSGNNKAGEGKMTITETRADSLVAIDLSFTRPMKAENEVNFTLEPSSHGTLVAWHMDGTHRFVSKLFGLFVNIDKMVGAQFEEGLANLKRVVETK